MERVVHPGEFYRHFKNKLYQVITVATHSETGEPMAVYQALYGDFRTYVRPLEMFLGEVDHAKYPEARQKYRFELVALPEGKDREGDEMASCIRQEPEDEEPPAPHTALLRFLDAATYEERLASLKELEKTAGQAEIDSLYVVLDMKPQAGTLSEQIEGIRRNLSMQEHYDGGHLR